MEKLESIKNQSGQLLIEAIVAISLMLIGLLGTFGVLSRSLGLNRVAADQYVATYLASEGIEVVKNIIDSSVITGDNWLLLVPTGDTEVERDSQVFLGDNDRKLLYHSDTGLYDYQNTAGAIQTKFERNININHISAEHILVTSRVTWGTRGGDTSGITVQEHFYEWRNLQ